ncbi:MAG: DUF488 domain-containing protein [Bacteroidetes bacterium]|nr:DUF488 domain-containing protein [Bacteroidota bacterium]MCL5737650.1 DUF488 domain-containing protein [Bacteroidota bacterium]
MSKTLKLKNRFKTKRVYEPASEEDSFRVFVERLWPRGISKEKAKIDLWLKDIAPSTELRKWFNHDPAKWNEFKKRYHDEIGSKKDLVEVILEKLSKGTVTLLYASREERYNAATALLDYLKGKK